MNDALQGLGCAALVVGIVFMLISSARAWDTYTKAEADERFEQKDGDE